ncbi:MULTISPECIES: GNAT family N-acetyltransferase [unclassified Endozoicomonas]|uniref:GNAT family N-acetyltransferase n=1 Tax=unclassified Endozoicomonas TaxID=2644528 RepID=UPI00214970E1|nr:MULTISPECIES: GNAT family N-acetyltransferase [unclassified Endozoicomonas]
MDFLVPSELETERLILRQFQDDDWRDLHEYYSDTVATKFTTGREFTEGETWRTMCGMIGHWQIRKYGPYAVVSKDSGKVLGPVGFWYPNDWPAPEIKWALAPRYWGKGYAKEATIAVQVAGREHIPNLPLISFINSENIPSIKLAESVGAVFSKATEFRGGIWHIYQHPTAT